jgi:hypothetical protein
MYTASIESVDFPELALHYVRSRGRSVAFSLLFDDQVYNENSDDDDDDDDDEASSMSFISLGNFDLLYPFPGYSREGADGKLVREIEYGLVRMGYSDWRRELAEPVGALARKISSNGFISKDKFCLTVFLVSMRQPPSITNDVCSMLVEKYCHEILDDRDSSASIDINAVVLFGPLWRDMVVLASSPEKQQQAPIRNSSEDERGRVMSAL